MRRVGRDEIIDMDMHMGGHVQTPGMGMQEWHQALQESQDQEQVKFPRTVTHIDLF